MRSLDPSSSVMVPLPDHTPAIPAKGPDWAWLAEQNSTGPAHAAAARIADRRAARIMMLPLLAGGFPASAAGDSARCSIPFARPGAAAELAIGKGAADRNPDEPAACHGPGYRRAGRRNLTIGHRDRIAGGSLARARFCDERHLPEAVVRCLGSGRSSCERSAGSQGGQHKKSTDAVQTHEVRSPIYVMEWVIHRQCVQSLLRCESRIRSP